MIPGQVYVAIDISMTEMVNELHFGDGSRVVVLELFGMENSYGKVECARNVYRLGKNEEPVWQVKSDFDSEGNPFTNITLNQEGSLVAYRWDGGTYVIDKENGYASPFLLLK